MKNNYQNKILAKKINIFTGYKMCSKITHKMMVNYYQILFVFKIIYNHIS